MPSAYNSHVLSDRKFIFGHCKWDLSKNRERTADDAHNLQRRKLLVAEGFEKWASFGCKLREYLNASLLQFLRSSSGRLIIFGSTSFLCTRSVRKEQFYIKEHNLKDFFNVKDDTAIIFCYLT